ATASIAHGRSGYQLANGLQAHPRATRYLEGRAAPVAARARPETEPRHGSWRKDEGNDNSRRTRPQRRSAVRWVGRIGVIQRFPPGSVLTLTVFVLCVPAP